MAPSLFDERFLRSASIVDQDSINQHPVVIIGVGAIGSQLAEMLAKLGVLRLTLIDFDEVDTINLATQGFYEAEVGTSKVAAVENRLRAINSQVAVEASCEAYNPEQILPKSVVICCVDSIKTRREIFRHFREKDWPVLFDGRMAAESLQVYCVTRTTEAMSFYRSSLFPSHEAYQESCTARATIYAASIAAAILCAQFKRWAMKQGPELMIQFDILSMDCFR